MSKVPDADNQSLAKFLALGSEIAGGVSGASVGLLVGGSGGAVVGAIVSPFAGRTVQVTGDFIRRQLSRREQVRAAGVLVFAADQLQRKLRAGYELRSDGFFDAVAGERVAGDEVIEGVLIAAQRQYQERKVPLLGTLLANVAIRTDIDPAHASRLIAVFDVLTYRQLCFLGLCGTRDRLEFPWQPTFHPDTPTDLLAVWDEIEDLVQRRLVRWTGGRVAEGPWTTSITTFDLCGVGGIIYGAMDLWQISPEDFVEMYSLLQRPVEEAPPFVSDHDVEP